jgi:hypothetical protein
VPPLHCARSRSGLALNQRGGGHLLSRRRRRPHLPTPSPVSLPRPPLSGVRKPPGARPFFFCNFCSQTLAASSRAARVRAYVLSVHADHRFPTQSNPYSSHLPLLRRGFWGSDARLSSLPSLTSRISAANCRLGYTSPGLFCRESCTRLVFHSLISI